MTPWQPLIQPQVLVGGGHQGTQGQQQLVSCAVAADFSTMLLSQCGTSQPHQHWWPSSLCCRPAASCTVAELGTSSATLCLFVLYCDSLLYCRLLTAGCPASAYKEGLLLAKVSQGSACITMQLTAACNDQPQQDPALWLHSCGAFPAAAATTPPACPALSRLPCCR